MKNVIHDWDDERARRILLNCPYGQNIQMR
jgi:hypothetical protein